MSFLSLPNEIIHNIIDILIVVPVLEHVFTTPYRHIHELLPLSETCKEIRSICLLYISNHLDIDNYHGKEARFSRQWLQSVSTIKLGAKPENFKGKVSEGSNVILTSDGLSFINSKILPSLKLVEYTYNSSSFDQGLSILLQNIRTQYKNSNSPNIFLKADIPDILDVSERFNGDKKYELECVTHLVINPSTLANVSDSMLEKSVSELFEYMCDLESINFCFGLRQSNVYYMQKLFDHVFPSLSKMPKLKSLIITIPTNGTFGLKKTPSPFNWIPSTITSLRINLQILEALVCDFLNHGRSIQELTLPSLEKLWVDYGATGTISKPMYMFIHLHRHSLAYLYLSFPSEFRVADFTGFLKADVSQDWSILKITIVVPTDINLPKLIQLLETIPGKEVGVLVQGMGLPYELMERLADPSGPKVDAGEFTMEVSSVFEKNRHIDTLYLIGSHVNRHRSFFWDDCLDRFYLGEMKKVVGRYFALDISGSKINRMLGDGENYERFRHFDIYIPTVLDGKLTVFQYERCHDEDR